jgi:hypothetical protein
MKNQASQLNIQMKTLINFQIIIRNSRHKISLERSSQESGTSQPLNHLVQNEINLTKGSDYVGSETPQLNKNKLTIHKCAFSKYEASDSPF